MVKGLIGSATLVVRAVLLLKESVYAPHWILYQMGGNVRRWARVVRHMSAFHHHYGGFLLHNREFLDNGTQLGMVKGLFGSAALVVRAVLLLKESAVRLLGFFIRGLGMSDIGRGLFITCRRFFITTMDFSDTMLSFSIMGHNYA